MIKFGERVEMGNKNLDIVIFVSGGLVQSVFCTKGATVSVEVVDLDLSDPEDQEKTSRRLDDFEKNRANFIKCY